MENLIKTLPKEKIKVVATITNNPHSSGIKRAKELGIQTIIIDHKAYADREAFDTKLVQTIQTFKPDLTILAGFMRILTPIFTDQIKAINIHPSLLPLFKGANAIEESFYSDMKVAGVTTHMVNSALDSGQIIDQACFEKEGLDFEAFKAKITQTEHQLYPRSIQKVLLT